jgi:hypothetical protein
LTRRMSPWMERTRVVQRLQPSGARCVVSANGG